MGLGYERYKLLIDKLFAELKQSFGEDVILSFAIFGSVARGEARENSDIDILVVHKPVEFDPVRRLAQLLVHRIYRSHEYEQLQRDGLNPDLYVIFMTEKDLYDRPLILLDILDHGIILYDDGTLEKRFKSLKKRLTELGSKKVVLDDGTWYWDLKPDWKPGEVFEL